MIFYRETKEVVAKFSNIFEHPKDCSSDGMNPFKYQDYLKLTMTSAYDITLQWKGLKSGGVRILWC